MLIVELAHAFVKWEKHLDSSMSSINLSVRDLEAFMALAQTQHFTRAAERCHLSQSAFSQKIRRIEDTDGVAKDEQNTSTQIRTELEKRGTVFIFPAGLKPAVCPT